MGLIWKIFIFHQKKLGEGICYHGNHDNMCKTFFITFLIFFSIHALKRMGFIWTISFFTKNGGEGVYVAMATIIICMKHLLNIPDIFCLILALKIIWKNGLDFKKFHFSQKFGKKCCHSNHNNMCKHFLNIPDIFF